MILFLNSDFAFVARPLRSAPPLAAQKFTPKRKTPKPVPPVSRLASQRLASFRGFFLELLIAIYIGYFGAGVGILVLSLLALLGMEDIHAMNGVKVLLVSVVNGVAMITFIFAKMIFWPQAVLMILGSLTGGYAGAHYAQKMNQQHVRWIVIAVGLSMSAYFFVCY
jgi:uncharacterized protein